MTFELLGREPVPTGEKLIELQLNDLEQFCRDHPQQWVIVPDELATALDQEQWETHRKRSQFDNWQLQTDETSYSLVVRFFSG